MVSTVCGVSVSLFIFFIVVEIWKSYVLVILIFLFFSVQDKPKIQGCLLAKRRKKTVRTQALKKVPIAVLKMKKVEY
jgi:hypothetical protein